MGSTVKRSDGTAAATSAAATGTKRYPPWLQKALHVKEQSERFWTRQQQVPHKLSHNSSITSNNDNNHTDTNAADLRGCESVWDAIATHNVGFVKEFVESDPQRVFYRREGARADRNSSDGVTLLHDAATHGALEIVRFLVSTLESQFPTETCRSALNSVDTVCSKTTPLIAACMSSEGMMDKRLEIVRLLVSAGADVSLQDAHGDNVLHWCAREAHTLLLRFLLKETDAGVAAIFVENCKREKPLDVAKRQLSQKPSMRTTSAFNLLRHVDRKCNIRMKLQVLRRFQSAQQSEDRTCEALQLQAALENASALLDRADQFWNDALLQAEKRRQTTEDAYITTAAQNASRAASEWLETKDGKAFVKKQLPAVTQELKLEVQMGKLPKPKDAKKAALQRVQETLCREKEAVARRQATEAFRAKTPAYPRESNTPPATLKSVLRIRSS